jgi:transposase
MASAAMTGKIGEHVMAETVIHADDTPVKMLDPCRDTTKTGRCRTCAISAAPWVGTARGDLLYTPDRGVDSVAIFMPSSRDRPCG